ncbi:MAG: NAD(P)/FAD-dependent oxidoreductase [Planctomycetota bacterium]
MSLREPVDVVIVGAGVIGAATAYHLAVADPRLKIAIIEQDHVGHGSTARSFAAYRKQFRSRVHIQASVLSQRELEGFEKLTGISPGMRQIGYLFLYSDQAQLDYAAQAVSRQRELGVPDAVVLTPAQIRDKWPYIDGKLAGATWCPSDGYLDPLGIAMGYVEAAKARGVQVLQGSRVTAIEHGPTGVEGVRLGDRLVRASRVVLALGAWMKRLAPEVPIAPVKRYIYTTPPLKQRDVSAFPMTILDLGPYVRCEARVSLAFAFDEQPVAPSPEEIPGVPPLPDQPDYNIAPGFGANDGVEGYATQIMIRLSEAMSFWLEEEIGIADASCGYYEVTPDHRCVIDRAPRISGLYFVAGASGHGIMHGPAYGMLAADLILDRPARIEGAREAFALGPLLRGEMRPDPEDMII